ncbi:hypothetical protein B0O95_105204 [Mycetohabitans endofungorum]|uniref:Uncharacterized protein n=1 Tax=Mycetohabitans endofungorum TaxID=417203 RepID=A0A2P5KBE6_9BURK|nr:hypothetical protein B0O95_105204 [Mycetohabitans endofungorum]
MTKQLFSRTGVRYEVALDVLGAIIAHHSEAIAVERDKPVPDEAVIERTLQKINALDALRDELDPREPETIERVIQQYAPQARELYGKRSASYAAAAVPCSSMRTGCGSEIPATSSYRMKTRSTQPIAS